MTRQTKATAGTQAGSGLAGIKLAFIGGLLRNHLVEALSITASHPRTERRDELERWHAIKTTADNRAAAHGADIILLTVKPQMLRAVFKDLRGAVSPSTLIISVVAGARIESIQKGDRKSVV